MGILSTAPGGWYESLDGTSMATPHVTGAVALCAAKYPSETMAQRVQRILGQVDPLAALSGKTTTGGRLDVAAAVNTVAPTPTPTPTPTLTPTVTLQLSGLKSGAMKLGKSVTAMGNVTPSSLAGGKVTLTAQLRKAATWVTVKTGSTTTTIFTGAYSSKYRPTKKGAYRMQTAIAATDAYAAATSKWLAFGVK